MNSPAPVQDLSKGIAPNAPVDRIIDSVHATLRESIIGGELKAGTRLSVPALARRLGVSRSPVREAVVRLAKEGLAREEVRRGAIVARIGFAELVSLYEIREVLEGAAARLAVERSGRRMVEDLRKTLDEHQQAIEANSIEANMRADMRFHRIIREASGNPQLIAMLDDIQAQVRLAMVTTTVTAGPQLALRDHRAIFGAIERGEIDSAERHARAHIARLRGNLESLLETERQSSRS